MVAATETEKETETEPQTETETERLRQWHDIRAVINCGRCISGWPW